MTNYLKYVILYIMAQGKAYTPEQRETIIKSLQSYLELGFSRNNACKMVGLAPQTLSNWVSEDEALGMRLEGWENAINKLALQNMRDVIMKEGENNDDKKENTRWWLERKVKEFNPKLAQDIKVETPKPIIDVIEEIKNEDA